MRTVSVFARPGHALEQHVAAREQRDEQPLEHRVLADDDALDLVQRLLERLTRRRARRRRQVDGGAWCSFGRWFLSRWIRQGGETRRSDSSAPAASSTSAPPLKAAVELALLVAVADARAELLVDRAQLLDVVGREGAAAGDRARPRASRRGPAGRAASRCCRPACVTVIVPAAVPSVTV